MKTVQSEFREKKENYETVCDAVLIKTYQALSKTNGISLKESAREIHSHYFWVL